MNDTRIRRAAALVDDARTLIVDVETDGHLPAPDRTDVLEARKALNRALLAVRKLLPAGIK